MKHNKLLKHFKKPNSDQLFDHLQQTFKDSITTWDYFVNWQKVFDNVKSVEKELHLLNYLVGKNNLEKEAFDLIKEYPFVIKAFPSLIGVREKSLQILVDTEKFIYNTYNFSQKELSDEDIDKLVLFLIKSGVGRIMQDKKVKSLVDYVMGVEAGLDSNGRKNRSGKMMEELVEVFIKKICDELNIAYLTEANGKKIKKEWNIVIEVDKSSRKIDFAINNKGLLYFIEVNFFGGGGSKLKSTAGEYIHMAEYWSNQGIEFIWITDGKGWQSTLNPLREYFDRDNYLLNIDMLSNEALLAIIS